MLYKLIDENLYLAWKETGQTPLESLQILLKETGHNKGTYAGRLDPMAEGLLLILTDDKVHEKEKFLGLDKTYEAEVLLGLETDSWDLLGLANKLSLDVKIDQKQLENTIKKLQGTHDLPIPYLSSPTHAGKPSWWQFRFGKKHEPLQRKMNFQIINLTNIQAISGQDILDYANIYIPNVNGDFRQKEILDTLHKQINPQTQFTKINLNATVSGGTYIRSLAYKIGVELGLPSTLFKLKRITVGKYKFDDKN